MQNNVASIDNKISVDEVSQVVSAVRGPLEGDVSAEGFDLKEELGALLFFIEQAKGEIASLRPKEYGTNKIPAAANELDAIVQGTEVAAEKVMDSADEIGVLAEKCDEETKAKLEQVSTNLFEASGFQDITGQRVSKVVSTLSHLEERLSALAETIGDSDVDDVSDEEGDVDKDYNAMANEEFLNGPQLDDEAKDQDAIDALFDDL